MFKIFRTFGENSAPLRKFRPIEKLEQRKCWQMGKKMITSTEKLRSVAERNRLLSISLILEKKRRKKIMLRANKPSTDSEIIFFIHSTVLFFTITHFFSDNNLKQTLLNKNAISTCQSNDFISTKTLLYWNSSQKHCLFFRTTMLTYSITMKNV